MLINAGSRDELENEKGIAHFLEHLLFKGTEKRSALKIISAIDESGGELNAYTSKEETFVYASFIKNDIRKAVDLVVDVVTHSIFPEKEIEKERGVIIDEINSYKDDPAEDIYDFFEENFFGKHPLGSRILGSKTSVKKHQKSDFQKFIHRCYNTDEMVFCTSGDFSFDRILKIVEPILSEVPTKLRNFQRTPVSEISHFQINKSKTIHGSHCLLGTQAFSRKDEKRLPFLLLNNVLGGPGLNSRLNLSLRENNGLTYHIESHLASFSDSGLWTLYFSTDKNKLNHAIELVYKELNQLRNKKLSPLQLSKAKKQMVGQLAIARENHGSMFSIAAKSFLTFGKVDTMKELADKIYKINSTEIQELANEIFDLNKISGVIYEGR
jgi:predicted Zn-dependent peptidase